MNETLRHSTLRHPTLRLSKLRHAQLSAPQLGAVLLGLAVLSSHACSGDAGSDDAPLGDAASDDLAGTGTDGGATGDGLDEDTAGAIPAEGDGLWAVGGDRDPNFAVAAAGWYRGDLHYHTNYSEDAKKQGGDELAVCIEIADAYRDPIWVGAHPDKAGNGLDFVAITDHRTDAHLSDPAFGHDHVIVIPGEEFGGSGHANIFGLKAHVSHDPVGEESHNQRRLDAIAEVHGQGALISINHPVQGNNWVWDTTGIDAVEIVNGPWTGFYVGSTLEELEADVTGAGTENPYIRDAFEGTADGHNARAVRFWQNHLTDGVHIAVVGGSDRHMIVPAALPTTYVRRPDGEAWAELEGPELGWEGVVAGIRQGGTFVSRSPFGAQVVLEAEGEDGVRRPMGAELPGVGTYTIHVTVSRAAGGELRLVSGPLAAPGEDGRIRSAPEVVWRQTIEGDLAQGRWTWEVPEGGAWLHALVLEQIAPEPLPPKAQAALDRFREPSEGDALLMMADALSAMIDGGELLFPERCDPEAWDAWTPQCMPRDQIALGTFYIPDGIERLLHIWYEDGQPTDWCFGAITAAFMVRAQ